MHGPVQLLSYNLGNVQVNWPKLFQAFSVKFTLPITSSRPGPLESITKPRLSTGSEFCIFNRFPRGHYLVWWVRVRDSLGVRVRVSVEVRVRVRVSNLLGSG